MSRFVRIPVESDNIVLINTEDISSVKFTPGTGEPEVWIKVPSEDIEYVASFDDEGQAKAFIEKNFILFNA